MSAYRFCRTDDIDLLVGALNRCWAPYFPDQPLMTPLAFKRLIRDLQVWCSSCMVAFSGADPIGVLIGAKRRSGTLVYRIAVHPDHRRQGHGRHLLASLGSKLAILGPPRIVAEVPDTLAPACELLRACGYVQEAVLTDYVRSPDEPAPTPSHATRIEGFVIPVTVDDLAANGLLGEADQSLPAAAAGPVQTSCWERSFEALMARKDEIEGLAIASEDRIAAYILWSPRGEILSLRSFIDDGGACLEQLLSRVGDRIVQFPKVHPAEISKPYLETLGFRPVARHLLYETRARSDAA